MSGADQRVGVQRDEPAPAAPRRLASFPRGLPAVPRLGIATRGNTTLDPDDVHYAYQRGVRYFNWCGKPDGLSRAMREFGDRRSEIIFAAQLKARTAEEAERELDWVLEQTGGERLDVGTLYYVESDGEWESITGRGGAWEAFAARRQSGELGLLGLTSHQRKLAASWVQQRSEEGPARLDMLMVRYNAAHVGAEQDVFPVTSRLRMPVVTFTGLRWRDLLHGTPADPPGFRLPTATDCYRFCLAHPAVSVTLAAPNGRAELEADLQVLDEPETPDPERMLEMRQHGRRVHRHAREFR